MSNVKKPILAGLVLVVVAAATYVIFDDYRARQVPPAALARVKNTSLRVSDCLSYEAQPTHVTYKELFDKIEKNVVEIDSNLIDVQTTETARNRPRVRPLSDYMKASQDVLRAQEALYRKQLDVSTAVDASAEALRDLRSSSYYGLEYARKAVRRASERYEKAIVEQQSAYEAFETTLQKVRAAREALTQIAPPDTLIDRALLSSVIVKLPREAAAAPGSPQNRTARSMQSIAAAWEARATDANSYSIGSSGARDADVSYEKLANALVPKYVAQLAPADAWGNPFQFRVEASGQVYIIRSPGANGLYEDTRNGENPDPNADLVYSNGSFISYPAGVQ
jgi:hypothetical protein